MAMKKSSSKNFNYLYESSFTYCEVGCQVIWKIQSLFSFEVKKNSFYYLNFKQLQRVQSIVLGAGVVCVCEQLSTSGNLKPETASSKQPLALHKSLQASHGALHRVCLSPWHSVWTAPILTK
jgi:hypothetical protein